MSDEPKTFRSFRSNLDLVLTEIGRWPVVTLVALVALTAMTLFVPDETGKLSSIDKTLLLAGSLFGILGMKGLSLLVIYPRLHKAAFPGSYLWASSIAFVPIFALYAIGLLILTQQDSLVLTRQDGSLLVLTQQDSEKPPLAGVVALLVLAYPVFVVLFAGFMRAVHTMSLHKGDTWGMVRGKWDAVAGRQDKPPPTN